MKFFTNMFSFLGEFIAKTTSSACWWTLVDEDDMPEELL